MTELILPRRQFLKAAVGIIAAPAVVRFESLMKLSAPNVPIESWRKFYSNRTIRCALDIESIRNRNYPPEISWRLFDSDFEVSDAVKEKWAEEDTLFADIPFIPQERPPDQA